MAPDCPECGSRDTERLPHSPMEGLKDYTCNECHHSWNTGVHGGLGGGHG